MTELMCYHSVSVMLILVLKLIRPNCYYVSMSLNAKYRFTLIRYLCGLNNHCRICIRDCFDLRAQNRNRSGGPLCLFFARYEALNIDV